MPTPGDVDDDKKKPERVNEWSRNTPAAASALEKSLGGGGGGGGG